MLNKMTIFDNFSNGQTRLRFELTCKSQVKRVEVAIL